MFPFEIKQFILDNKEIVKKYLKSDTYKIVVPDLEVTDKHYYKNQVNILKSGSTFEYSDLQKLEYIKCMRDVVYFTKKYVKIISIDDGLIPFDPYDYQEELLSMFQKNRFVIAMQARQTGKMIDINTPIMTPTGFVKNGDLKVGDKIYGRDGKVTTVTFISEQRNDMSQYELTFDNGQKIKACGEHLWSFSTSDRKERVANTEDMISDFKNLKKRKTPGSVWIDSTKPLEFSSNDELPFDPYTLGLWLGDGSSSCGNITCTKQDFDECYTKHIPTSREFKLENGKDVTGNFVPSGLFKFLRTNNLINNKHIPDMFIYTSVKNRIALIQGLMDSDGYVAKNGSCEFYQKSESFIDSVRLILSTLGVKTRKHAYKVDGYDDYYHKLVLTVPVSKFKLFRLPRKLERQYQCKNHPQNERIYLKEFKELNGLDKVTMQCLTVNNEDHMFLCGDTLIPTHNTTTTASYLLHYATFNLSKSVAILANKASQAREILSRVQLSYEGLPFFLKQGVTVYNKGSMKFSNLSEIFCGSSSSSSIRGKSISLLYIDEAAFLRGDMEFYESTYPTISSGKESRIIVTSTPNGARGLFYKLWSESVEGTNMFKPICVPWYKVPGRDEAWKSEQIRNTSAEQFNQEHACVFRGSQNSLLSSDTLSELVIKKPVAKYGDLFVYKEPSPDRTYFITVDTSRGLGYDYSAFIVFDITESPYEIVATYRNNRISPLIYPQIVKTVGDKYNNAYVLVEINDIGEQVGNLLYYDFEYENLLMCFIDKNTQKIGFVRDARVGVRTSTSVKSIGCSNVKTMVETGKLILNDEDTINEFGTFVPKGKSYEADSGAHDDLVMCCVMFAWASGQQYFIDLVDRDIRKSVQESLFDEIMEDILPFGFIDNGIEEFDGSQTIERPYGTFS